jgi:hypothetical protein
MTFQTGDRVEVVLRAVLRSIGIRYLHIVTQWWWRHVGCRGVVVEQAEARDQDSVDRGLDMATLVAVGSPDKPRWVSMAQVDGKCARFA